MKSLKNCIELSSSVKIYVPSTINVNEKVDTTEWVDRMLRLLGGMFSGSTASKALGTWISARGDLVKEDVTLVFSFATQEALEENIEKIVDECNVMKRELLQESIAIEVNNKLYII